MIDTMSETTCPYEVVPLEDIRAGIDAVVRRYKKFSKLDRSAVRINTLEFPVTENHYSRTTIYNDGETEILVCVWNRATDTSLHNHGGSDCGFVVLKGKLVEEVVYVHRNRYLNRAGNISRSLLEGDSAYLSDPYRFHRITSTCDSNIVSVHLYSPPLKHYSELLPNGQLASRSV